MREVALLLFLAATATAAAAQNNNPAAAIAIADAALHPYDDGPPLRSGDVAAPGDGIWVSARFSGYSKKVDEEKDRQNIHLTYRFEVVDSEGIAVVAPKGDKIEAEIVREDKNWMPKVRHNFLLPPLADSGNYKVILQVRDELNRTEARKELPFQVKGLAVEPSKSLVARNFRFLRTEEDGKPLAQPVYRPGDTVWARFEMTGYKLGERNAFDVAYGLEVFRAGGQSMYKEPEAAREKDATFYRKRFTQGALSLNLQKDIAKGEYMIVLRLTDAAGGQTAESRHSFTVE